MQQFYVFLMWTCKYSTFYPMMLQWQSFIFSAVGWGPCNWLLLSMLEDVRTATEVPQSNGPRPLRPALCSSTTTKPTWRWTTPATSWHWWCWVRTQCRKQDISHFTISHLPGTLGAAAFGVLALGSTTRRKRSAESQEVCGTWGDYYPGSLNVSLVFLTLNILQEMVEALETILQSIQFYTKNL